MAEKTWLVYPFWMWGRCVGKGMDVDVLCLRPLVPRILVSLIVGCMEPGIRVSFIWR
jgi:hypothetical protein